MLSAITRARWLPLVVAIAAGYLALSEHEVILPESVLRDGVSFRLWVIAVIGYMIGCTASVALRFARRGAT